MRSSNEFTARSYLRAASERISEAQEGREQQRYVVAYYLAGVAVECVLLAYLLEQHGTREDHHDLLHLAHRRGWINHFRSEDLQLELTTDLAEVYARWRNDHRYRSLDSLRRFLNRTGLYRTSARRFIKGDVVAANCDVIVEAATRLVQAGVANWKSYNTS